MRFLAFCFCQQCGVAKRMRLRTCSGRSSRPQPHAHGFGRFNSSARNSSCRDKSLPVMTSANCLSCWRKFISNIAPCHHRHAILLRAPAQGKQQEDEGWEFHLMPFINRSNNTDARGNLNRAVSSKRNITARCDDSIRPNRSKCRCPACASSPIENDVSRSAIDVHKFSVIIIICHSGKAGRRWNIVGRGGDEAVGGDFSRKRGTLIVYSRILNITRISTANC